MEVHTPTLPHFSSSRTRLRREQRKLYILSLRTRLALALAANGHRPFPMHPPGTWAHPALGTLDSAAISVSEVLLPDDFGGLDESVEAVVFAAFEQDVSVDNVAFAEDLPDSPPLESLVASATDVSLPVCSEVALQAGGFGTQGRGLAAGSVGNARCVSPPSTPRRRRPHAPDDCLTPPKSRQVASDSSGVPDIVPSIMFPQVGDEPSHSQRFHGKVNKLIPTSGPKKMLCFIKCTETRAIFGKDIFVRPVIAQFLVTDQAVSFSVHRHKGGPPQAHKVMHR